MHGRAARATRVPRGGGLERHAHRDGDPLHALRPSHVGPPLRRRATRCLHLALPRRAARPVPRRWRICDRAGAAAGGAPRQPTAADGAQIAEEVRAAHAAHHGVRCRGISWARWGDRADELAEIAGCLGGEALAAICECFAQDYGGWHGGMPDLVVWQRRDVSFSAGAAADIDARSSYGEARLVEVKSPSDKLSDQQRAWLHRLASRGVLVEVCRVAEGEPTQTERLRPSFAPPIPLSQPPAPVPDAPPPMLPPVYHRIKISRADHDFGQRERAHPKTALSTRRSKRAVPMDFVNRQHAICDAPPPCANIVHDSVPRAPR